MNIDPPSDKSRSQGSSHIQEGVDYVKLFYLMLSNWYRFLIVIIMMLMAAWLYIRFTPPIWQVSAKVLIEEETEMVSPIAADQLLEGFGVRPGMQNLDNQLHILTSWSLIDQTLDDLPFDIECLSPWNSKGRCIIPGKPGTGIY